MKQEPKQYDIGGKVFIQQKLVLGQWKELDNIIGNITIPQQFTPASLVRSLGNNLFLVFAVVLTEEGKSLKGKDLPAIADEIEYEITPDTAIEVIADFFEFNPIASLLSNLKGLAKEIKKNLTAIGLTNSATSLATETLQSETGFSGTLQPETPENGPHESLDKDTNG